MIELEETNLTKREKANEPGHIVHRSAIVYTIGEVI